MDMYEKMMNPSADEIRFLDMFIKSGELENFLETMQADFNESIRELYANLQEFRIYIFCVAYPVVITTNN